MPEPTATPTPRANVPELSVSELSSAIKRALEEGFGFVRLRGEISGYRGPHASGHCYFSLKDDKAKIEAVVWRGVFQRLRFKPQEGIEVVATGKVTTYPGSSKYQIVIEALEPAGVGALMALLEERKKKLAAEGLFAEDRKRPLPFLPSVVGIVTSPTGAVIRDMLAGFAERFPARVVVWAVRVQGETCAAEVAAAIRGFNALPVGGRIPRPDVLIVARGGGSLEDLWGFNEEIVVRAAAESAIPLVSAVGHETDWTLIDLAADARAPTPTKAAEWVVPKHSELLAETQDLGGRLRIAVRRKLEAVRVELRAAARGIPRLEDLLALPRQRFDGAAARLGQAFRALVQGRRNRLADEMRLARALLANTRAHATRHVRVAARLQPRLLGVRIERARERLGRLGQAAREALSRTAGRRRQRLAQVSGGLRPQALAVRLERADERLAALVRRGERAHRQRIAEERRRLDALGQMLTALSYQGVLKRGFALVRDESGRAVRSATAVSADQRVSVELADGRFGARVTEPADADAPGESRGSSSAARPPRPARPSRSGSGGQGSLF